MIVLPKSKAFKSFTRSDRLLKGSINSRVSMKSLLKQVTDNDHVFKCMCACMFVHAHTRIVFYKDLVIFRVNYILYNKSRNALILEFLPLQGFKEDQ